MADREPLRLVRVGVGALNLAAIPSGLVLSPRRPFGAWVRGRRSRTSIAVERRSDDALLARLLRAVRAEMGLDEPASGATLADGVTFVVAAVLAKTFALLPPAAIVGPVLALRA